MKTKRLLPIAAMLTVASVASCSKEPTADRREQFVGTYLVSLTVTTTGNTVLVNDTSATVAVAKSGEDNFTAQTAFSLQSFAVNLEFSTDSVFWHHAAGKSSVFKIPEQPVKISGANAGTVKGSSLGSSSYHGGFGYNNVGDRELSLRATGYLTPMPNMVIPITVTINGTIQK